MGEDQSSKSDIETIVEKVNEGKTYSQVAEEVGLSSKSSISMKIRDSDYVRNNKLTLGDDSNNRVPLTEKEIREASQSEEGEVYYRKKVEDDCIKLVLVEDALTKKEEPEED